MSESGLGPVLSATIFTSDLDLSIRVYGEYLNLSQYASSEVSPEIAARWHCPALAGAPQTWLQNQLGEPWLRIIESEHAGQIDPFRHTGWLSLEISVHDTDALLDVLRDSPFEVIGEPANLELSDAIRAMQVKGPSAEVLYLTEVKAEVPPFELPFARCEVDRLFIPVLLSSNRDTAMDFYEKLAGVQSMKFDTRVTVINRARGLPVETRHPIATLQLRGNSLIEIDQLQSLTRRETKKGYLPPGIALISFAVDQLPTGADTYQVPDGPLAGHQAVLQTGAADKLIELIEKPPHRKATKFQHLKLDRRYRVCPWIECFSHKKYNLILLGQFFCPIIHHAEPRIQYV